MNRILKTFSAVLLTVVAIAAMAVSTKIGPYGVEVATDPSPVPVGRANLQIRITDQAGKGVPGLKVSAIARMPGMNMGEREEVARETEKPGEYVAPAIFSMAGLYVIEVAIDGQKGSVEMRTGQATGPEAGGGWLSKVLWGFALLAAAAFVLHRTRKTGQRLDVATVLNRQVIGALAVLAAALAVAIWAVNTQRRPGSMTPIESQAMEMNTPAPEGVLAVTLSPVEERTVEATVTYTGQAMGFVEQDVVARVAGTIQWMGVYVGDHVRKGQMLARLDTSQLDPEVAMRSASVDRARQGVGVAALEHEEALTEAEQARAEVGVAKGERAEAESMLRAAEQGRAGAEADVQAAAADLDAMRAEQTSADAEAAYATAEFDRAKGLFASGAISRDEYQRSKADVDKAHAMASQARQRVRRAEAMVAAARANLRRSEAELSAAQKRVDQTSSGVRAKEAMVRTADAAAKAARARISQEQAMVRESAATLQGATAQRGYAQLRAEADGVVTQRLISPGQLVSAGQAILRVAQVSPIRLQANLPERDLALVRPGAKVVATSAGSAGVEARISSVAPSVDQASRTGVVEALYPNIEGAIRPGQFVKMEIQTGSEERALVVPISAIQYASATSQGVLADSQTAYLWVADPEPSGQYLLRRQQVKLGLRGRDHVAVAEGVKAGQKVVVSPSADFQDGRRVVPRDVGGMDENPVVTVTESGYDPPTVPIPAGKAITITFIRKTDLSCAEELVFPDLGIRRKLPVGEPVKVEIPARRAGELKFACGMDMFRGKVVVR